MREPLGLRRRCWNCVWFAENEGYDGGSCWRFPPTPAFQAALDGSGNIQFENLRPYVGKTEGCGEWQQGASTND